METKWKTNFFIIWSGQAISDFTSNILQFAIVWMLTKQTDSPMILSFAIMAGFLPDAVLGSFAGVAIDRFNRKTVMIVSDIFIAATSGFLAVLCLFGSAPVWVVMVVLVARSIGTAIHKPCIQAVTPQIVPREELAKCAGYSQSIKSVSLLLSPAAAAFLFSRWTISAIAFLDILGAAIAVLTLMFTIIPLLPQNQKEKISIIKDTIDGFKILQKNKGMFGIVGVGALYTAALMPISALFPIMCLSYFGGTSGQAAFVEILFSSGVLGGSLFLSVTGGFKNKIYTIFAATMLMSVCLLVNGLIPTSGIYIFAVAALFMGICAPCFWGSQTALLQQSFPHEYLGRIMAITGSIRVIASPISLSLSGILSEKFGPQIWFLIACTLTFSAGLICILIPVIRNCDKRPNSLNPANL